MEAKYIYLNNDDDIDNFDKILGNDSSIVEIEEDSYLVSNNIIISSFDKIETSDWWNDKDLTSTIINYVEEIVNKMNDNKEIETKWVIGKDTIYVSIHPGGDKGEIKNKIYELNNQNTEDKNIKITYHGSQNINDWNEIESIDKLNKRVKKFIEPEVEAEMDNNNEIVLLQHTLISEFFDGDGKIDEELFVSVFNIQDDERKSEIIEKFIAYCNSLIEVNVKYDEFKALINNINTSTDA